MGNATETSPHLNVSYRTNPSAWVHISIQQNITLRLKVITGAKGALVNEQSGGLHLRTAVTDRLRDGCDDVMPQSSCTHDRFVLIALETHQRVPGAL